MTTTGRHYGDPPPGRTAASAADGPHTGALNRIEATDEPFASPEFQYDTVLEASWESFPASDSPAWNGAERPKPPSASVTGAVSGRRAPMHTSVHLAHPE
jgi:hypothetical protein